MMIRKTVLLAFLLGAIGCDDAEEETAPNESAQAPSEPEAAPEAAPAPTAEADTNAGPSASDDSFTLEARGEEGYASGSLSQFGIHLEGKGEWHVNEDFPFSVSLEASSGINLAKAELGKDDAAEFGEEGIQLDVPFTPTAEGEQRLTARVSFAMCNPQSCVPKTETIALNVAVTPQS